MAVWTVPKRKKKDTNIVIFLFFNGNQLTKYTKVLDDILYIFCLLKLLKYEIIVHGDKHS